MSLQEMDETERERLEIMIPYAPRRAFINFHRTKRRWAIIVAHRRAGKTVAAVNKLIREAIACPYPDGRYGLVAPFRSQAKDIAWIYLQRFAEPLLAEPPNESELRVKLQNGAVIRLYGADNPDALRGAYFDGIILDEYGLMREGVWTEIVRPMLADRKGWAVFIGTPKGANAFRKLWRDTSSNTDWFRALIRADTSNIIDADELEDMQEDMSPEEFDQEMLCSFEAAVRGAYYAEQLRRMDAEGRITHIDIDRGARVHTAWDLGRRDYMAIWFIQCVGRERRLVDYYENNFQDLAHYAEVIHDKKRARNWIYGEHYFPHDIQQHMLDTKLSRLETLRTLGIEATYPLNAHNVMDGINATRRMLDRTWIDPDYCEKGIDHLRNYRADWDEGMRVFKTNPRHDEHSHGADALRCFSTQYDDPKSVADDGRWRRRYKPGGTPSSWSA
jgi:phage terminase large subunit